SGAGAAVAGALALTAAGLEAGAALRVAGEALTGACPRSGRSHATPAQSSVPKTTRVECVRNDSYIAIVLTREGGAP
ncbi:MAG TPA: hypothetical protein VGK73_07945, partial [Polyangiaceae bacterium]